MNLLSAKNTTIRPNEPPPRECSDGPILIRTIPMTIPATRFGLGSHVRAEARTYFFSVLREVWPELLREIKRELFPAYLKWAENYSASRPAGATEKTPRSFLEMELVAPEMAAAVLTWCSKYHLVGEIDVEPECHGTGWESAARTDSLWPAMDLVETLWVWSQPKLGSCWLISNPPDWPHKSTWFGRVGGPRKLAVPIPEMEGFNTTEEYVRQATRSFVRLLREDLRQQGLPFPSLRRRSVKFPTNHFTWLALRQAHGWSDQEIVEWHRRSCDEHVQTDAVRMGVRNAAKAIGLRLRSRARGRPRKTKIFRSSPIVSFYHSRLPNTLILRQAFTGPEIVKSA